MAATADLSGLRLVEMHATEPTATRAARAAAITGLLDTNKKNRKLGFGLGLVRENDKWLISDLHLLPNANGLYNFITRFRELEPNAKEVPVGSDDQPRPVPRG
jgi:hypothetical protein